MGGSSGGGPNTTTQEFKPPAWTLDAWNSYKKAGEKISQTPYAQSGLPTVAPQNDYQQTAYQLAYDRGVYGAPDMNAARGTAMNAAQGNFANPFGSSEYNEQVIGDNAKNMAEAYATGDAAHTDASFAMDGAFGGSAYQQAKTAGAAGLAKQVGQMSNQSRQAHQQYAGGLYNQDVQNMLSGAGLAGQLSQDDYRSIGGLQDAGNAQAGYYQKLMDAANQQWGTQSGYDAVMNEYLGSVLGRASGSYGGTATTQPGQSPWAQAGGLIAGGAGLYSLFK